MQKKAFPNSHLEGTPSVPQISVRYLLPLFRYLRMHHGALAERYLDIYGLDESQFESEQTIGMDRYQTMLECAAEESGDTNLGLKIYETLDLKDLGILGYAMTSAADVRSAMTLNIRYNHLYQSGMGLAMEEHGNRVHMTYRVLSPGLGYSRQDSEISMMFGVFVIRLLTNLDWRPEEAHFQHSAPDSIAEHKALLCQKLYFDQPTNRVVFDKNILNHPISNANQHLFHTMEEALRRIVQHQEQNDDALLESIQREVIAALPEALPNIEQVAETLGIGARTLQRRLSDKGYSFSKLLDMTRRQLAMNYLQNSSMTTTEIAFLLAYSESSAFDRAFKRWTSMKPLEYRQHHSE